jgi:hypothetical protein
MMITMFGCLLLAEAFTNRGIVSADAPSPAALRKCRLVSLLIAIPPSDPVSSIHIFQQYMALSSKIRANCHRHGCAIGAIPKLRLRLPPLGIDEEWVAASSRLVFIGMGMVDSKYVCSFPTKLTCTPVAQQTVTIDHNFLNVA